GSFDRYRVTTRSVSDGRGGTSTLTLSYTGLGLSSDGKEFRGHASVRAVDPFGHYTDTRFEQDDLLRGRPSQSQTRQRNGALLAETTNTWATTTPYPGVTSVTLAQTDVATCDDTGASCKIARQSFEFDSYGNRTATTDARGCTTTTVYEASQTYPASVTTCLGHTTAFAYDARWGERTTETDPNHQGTTYTYDTFGRLTKTTGPLDTGSLYGSMSR